MPSSLQNSAGRSGPRATRAAPVSVAQSTSRDGFSLKPHAADRTGTSRPSRRCCRSQRSKPVRVRNHVRWAHRSSRHGIFDVNRYDTARRLARSASITTCQPRTVAAPPMSFFIRSNTRRRLQVVPAVSKQTPFPHSDSRGDPSAAALPTAKCELLHRGDRPNRTRGRQRRSPGKLRPMRCQRTLRTRRHSDPPAIRIKSAKYQRDPEYSRGIESNRAPSRWPMPATSLFRARPA